MVSIFTVLAYFHTNPDTPSESFLPIRRTYSFLQIPAEPKLDGSFTHSGQCFTNDD